jgi:hypothetical protein
VGHCRGGATRNLALDIQVELRTIEDSEIIIRIHSLTFWQKFLVNDSFGIEENG